MGGLRIEEVLNTELVFKSALLHPLRSSLLLSASPPSLSYPFYGSFVATADEVDGRESWEKNAEFL